MSFELFKIIYLALLHLCDAAEEMEKEDQRLMDAIDHLEKVVDLFREDYLH